ncbi:hypothetical protein BFJ69_g16202 [Fusarium oxysporum]|uniref:Uncharacterized protein n=1 Tax=Fusarium oxysporum TaxID=5507 RepID=A0A420MBX5_FUSOX|nr:hypothetical protein BFJ69_g16202 [Fusarium oxysporum]
MKSPDEKAFDQRVQELERRYLPQYIEEVGYIKANWLDPYKERLVRAWVDQHPHFGNVVTSRVEGIHGLLKSHLKKSTLDLFEAWRAMKHALLNQLAELQSNQASQQMRIPIELSGSLYSAIRGWVSHEALRNVEEQRKLLLKEHLPSCTGAFSRSHGLLLRPYSPGSTRTQSAPSPGAFSHILAPQSPWCSPVTTGASASTRSDSRRFEY